MRHTARDGTRGIRKIDVLSHHAGGESGCARSQFGDGAPSGSVGRVVVVLPPPFPPSFFLSIVLLLLRNTTTTRRPSSRSVVGRKSLAHIHPKIVCPRPPSPHTWTDIRSDPIRSIYIKNKRRQNSTASRWDRSTGVASTSRTSIPPPNTSVTRWRSTCGI